MRPSELRIFKAIFQNPGLRRFQIALLLEIHPSGVCTAVKQFKIDRLLINDDRVLQLTDKGKEVVQ